MAVRDNAYEPNPGLPGMLPKGERVLWRGRPHWLTLARTAFMGDWVAIWFAALVAWRLVDGLSAGAPTGHVVAQSLWLALMGVVALAIIAALAWQSARTTVYTITNRRVAMRIGMALSVTLNAPFKRVASAALKPQAGGRGDLSLTIGGKDRFAYLLLWPHARPWRLGRPQPTLRAIPDAASVAALLADALQAFQAQHGVDAPLADAAPEPRRPARSGGMVPAE